MPRTPPNSDLRLVPRLASAAEEGQSLLLVEPTRSLPLSMLGVEERQLTVMSFAQIDGRQLNACAPDIVLAPLVSRNFDILDLARLLCDCGFQGKLRAYCAPLPNTRVIRAEVTGEFPILDFDIFEVPPDLSRDH